MLAPRAYTASSVTRPVVSTSPFGGYWLPHVLTGMADARAAITSKTD